MRNGTARSWVAFFLAALCAGRLAWGAEGRTVLAVFNIDARGAKLNNDLLESINRHLRKALGECWLFNPVPTPDHFKDHAYRDKYEKLKLFEKCFDRRCQIPVAHDLEAEKALATRLVRTGRSCTIVSNLFHLEGKEEPLGARVKGPCTKEGLRESIEKVAAIIRARSAHVVSTPASAAGSRPKQPLPPRLGREQEATVMFATEPEGAEVRFDGELICPATPCTQRVRSGAHQVSMKMASYDERSGSISISDGKCVDWELKPSVGWVTVRSEPSDLELKLDGRAAGRTPIEKHPLPPGEHEVLLTSPCHEVTRERVSVERERERIVSLAPMTRNGRVAVETTNGQDEEVTADVYLDGVHLGRAPGVFPASLCAKWLEVKHEKFEAKRKVIEVKEGQVLTVALTLSEKNAAEGMVAVPAGWFWIGCDPQYHPTCRDSETPARRIFLDTFAIDKTEVTVAQYAGCVLAGRCEPPQPESNWTKLGFEEHPISCVDWHKAKAFCEWVGKRLPTEAEWEKAARGDDGRVYPWGDEDPSCARANSAADKGASGCDKASAWPVCSRSEGNSAYGLCDMAGNLDEWIADWFDEKAYASAPARNPHGPVSGSQRVSRGGSWLDPRLPLGTFKRAWFAPSDNACRHGFRCARSANVTP